MATESNYKSSTNIFAFSFSETGCSHWGTQTHRLGVTELEIADYFAMPLLHSFIKLSGFELSLPCPIPVCDFTPVAASDRTCHSRIYCIADILDCSGLYRCNCINTLYTLHLPWNELLQGCTLNRFMKQQDLLK